MSSHLCNAGPVAGCRAETYQEETAMAISPQLFLVLFFFCFFGGLGIFFIGVGYLWQVSLQAKAMKKGPAP